MAIRGGFLVSFVFIIYVLFFGSAVEFSNNEIDSCMLSPVLLPNIYDLKLDLDYQSRTFDGEVTITGVIENETKYILFDSAVSNVSDQVIISDLDGNAQIKGTSTTEEMKLKIEFEEELKKGNYSLKLTFSGEIRREHGIYGGNYTSADNQESYFIATEFQPNYARFAFPCIDRPAYKARFVLNVSSEDHLVALSNMPLSSSLPDAFNKNKRWNSFEMTPKMSTYTFAFVVADIVPSQPPDNETPFNNTVWVIRGNERLAESATKWAPLYMKELEEYTDIKYEIPKMDHVALPYLSSTAMENWGLITYKQEVLHLNTSSHTVKNEFALVWILAHEMTHQWFGNLVTCSSWAYTWLNEGLTSFLHFLISGKVFKHWDTLGLMMSEEVLKIMDDEGFSAVSLTKDNCTMDASDAFSMPSYYKGAALVRTVYYMIGEEGLKEGLRKYLLKNKYGCVAQEDLWVHFDEAAWKIGVLPKNITVGTIMNTWSNNQGFPFVTVTRKKDSIQLEQARLVFFLPDESPDQKWWIPLSYTTSLERNFSKVMPRFFMDPKIEAPILNIRLNHDDWIIFNIDQSGYYRVLYDNLTWASITRQLRSKLDVVPPLTRAKLIDDVYTLAFYKKLHYRVPLALSWYLTKETHYYPLAAAIRALDHIHFYIKTSNIIDRFEKFMLMLVENVFEKLSKAYDNNYNETFKDNNLKLLFGKLLHFACNLGHKGCEARARIVMEHLLKNDQEYIRQHLDEINPLMCTMVRLGDQDIWNLAFEMYKKEKLFKPKEEIMEALKCTSDRNVWKKLTKSFINEEEDYLAFDLFTTSLYDNNSYCYVIEVIKEILNESYERYEYAQEIIKDLSGVPMADKCKKELRDIAKEFFSDDLQEIITAQEKSAKPWQRIKEIEEWLDEQTNSIDAGLYNSDSGDNSLNERSLDGLNDEFSLTYPHLRSPNDYDYESRHGKVNQEKSSGTSASAEFNLFILLFSILPSPLYLTYLLFAPLL